MNKAKIELDKFSGSKVIDWEYVSGRMHNIVKGINFEDAIITGSDTMNFSKIIFSPVHKNKNNYLKFRLQDNILKPKKGASISFLFQDNTVEVFVFQEDPVEIGSHINWGKIKEILIPISSDQIESFISKKFISWKYISSNIEVKYKDGISIEQYNTLSKVQDSIVSLFKDFKSIAAIEVPESLSKKSKPVESSTSICYVYLMKDTTNNAFKIGISNSPKFREKTLQSEKPTIELVYSKQFYKREIAEIFEKVLHDYFSNKRIRGEWFELSNGDIVDLKRILT